MGIDPITPPPVTPQPEIAAKAIEPYVPPPGVFRAPRALRSWTAGLLITNGVMDAAAIGLSVATLSFLAGVKGESGGDENFGMLIDLAVGLQGLAAFAIYIATVVVFCCWFYRINLNAALISAEKPPMGPGMAVGSFFIPIACLYFPYKAAAFSWKVSARAADARSPESGWVVGAWWAVWILVNIIGQILFRQAIRTGFADQPPSIEELERNEYVMIVGSIAGMLSAALATVMVCKVSALQARVGAVIEGAAQQVGR